MYDKSRRSFRPGEPKDNSGGDQSLPDVVVLTGLIVLAVVCVAGYFFLMKLIDISRQEDCLMAGRRNCAPIAVPSDR